MERKYAWTDHAFKRFRQRFPGLNRFEVFDQSERVKVEAYKRYTGGRVPNYLDRINYKVGALFIIEVSPITKKLMIVTVFNCNPSLLAGRSMKRRKHNGQRTENESRSNYDRPPNRKAGSEREV